MTKYYVVNLQEKKYDGPFGPNEAKQIAKEVRTKSTADWGLDIDSPFTNVVVVDSQGLRNASTGRNLTLATLVARGKIKSKSVKIELINTSSVPNLLIAEKTITAKDGKELNKKIIKWKRKNGVYGNPYYVVTSKNWPKFESKGISIQHRLDKILKYSLPDDVFYPMIEEIEDWVETHGPEKGFWLGVQNLGLGKHNIKEEYHDEYDMIYNYRHIPKNRINATFGAKGQRNGPGSGWHVNKKGHAKAAKKGWKNRRGLK